MEQELLIKFQSKINYNYQNKALLKEALTHSSYANENKNEEINHNERLEFLGDSVLGIVISNYLYRNTNLPEGQLTKKRALIVCERSLMQAGKKLDLGKYLFLGKGEEITGGRQRTSILADAFEAVIGSIYLDSDIESAQRFILESLKDIIEESLKGNLYRDNKTELQEILQSRNKSEKIKYQLVNEYGPDHNKKFVMEIRFMNECLGMGEGRTKKEAEQEAAKEAIKRFK